MSNEKLINEIKRLRDLRYTWKQVRETLFKEANPPGIATLQRWVKGHKPPIPIHEKPCKILPEYEDKVREVFIRQLRSMGYTSQEIKKELKMLLPK
jgi:DNA-binding transcriptional MerR regulator